MPGAYRLDAMKMKITCDLECSVRLCGVCSRHIAKVFRSAEYARVRCCSFGISHTLSLSFTSLALSLCFSIMPTVELRAVGYCGWYDVHNPLTWSEICGKNVKDFHHETRRTDENENKTQQIFIARAYSDSCSTTTNKKIKSENKINNQRLAQLPLLLLLTPLALVPAIWWYFMRSCLEMHFSSHLPPPPHSSFINYLWAHRVQGALRCTTFFFIFVNISYGNVNTWHGVAQLLVRLPLMTSRDSCRLLSLAHVATVERFSNNWNAIQWHPLHCETFSLSFFVVLIRPISLNWFSV